MSHVPFTDDREMGTAPIPISPATYPPKVSPQSQQPPAQPEKPPETPSVQEPIKHRQR